jgi:ferritin-like metal-binding protein YciE
MEKGRDFLRSQINNAVALHQNLIDSMQTHAKQADDTRFRDLCTKHLGVMERHQGMLEQYQRTIGAGAGAAKKVMSKVASAGKGIVEAARTHDFLRLVGDIVMARQAEDTFKTFREAGRAIGEAELARIGEEGERDMDVYVKEANALAQQLFVECAQEAPVAAR